MAVYYLGNPAEKRKKLMGNKDAVYLDNDEVLAVYGKKGKYYFIVGRTQFADFTIWEYLSYTKSLELRRPLRMEEAKDLLSRVGIDASLNKKLKNLDSVTLKTIKLATVLKPDTTRICFNFDGLAYARRLYRKMQKLLLTLSDYQIVISVSDIRYVPKEGAIEWFLDGDAVTNKVKIIRESKKAIKLLS